MKANKENSSPSVPAANLDRPFQGFEAAQPQQKDPQPLTQLQQQHQEQSEQPKTPPPQPSPPRQAKHTTVDYPEDEATAPPRKIPRLETTPLPLPPDWKPPIALASSEADASGPVEASDLPEVQIPPPANQAPVHEPPSLGPPPPLPFSHVTGMASSSCYMPGEGYQNLQSMTMTNGSSYGARHPAYGPPAHLHYQPHVYSPNPPPPPVFPPPASFLLPNIPLRIPRYPPLLPHIYSNFPPPPPPPCRPPIHVAPPHPLQGLGLPPVSYLPPAIPPERQRAVTTLIPQPGMPPVRGIGWATWMR